MTVQAAHGGVDVTALAHKDGWLLVHLGMTRVFSRPVLALAQGVAYFVGLAVIGLLLTFPCWCQPGGGYGLENAGTGLWGAGTPGLMDATGRYAVWSPWWRGRRGWPVLYEVRAAEPPPPAGGGVLPRRKMEGAESPEEPAPCGRPGRSWGFPQSSIRVLGRLDFIAHRANFIMYPILAVVDRGAAGGHEQNPAEVEETFQVPSPPPVQPPAPGIQLQAHASDRGGLPL